MSFVPPYTVTVTAVTGGVAQCSYMDADGQVVPAGQPLTTATPAGLPGELAISFVETTVGDVNLRLVGATVKTVGNDPTLSSYNYLYASRAAGEQSGQWVDAVVVPWAPDKFTLRGVVLLFAQVDSDGNMISFVPSSDPQVKNDEA